jgi:asparagine synthase (glutamine-hydrolysing)
MRDTLVHRGPDAAGLWADPGGRVLLAHRRLSIIDLSPCAHQPMTDESGQVCVVFNGEIYNYRDVRLKLELEGRRFRTASDTEVLLAAYLVWGVECLAHFNGMFAFALYDTARRQLFVARDRAGEKPLFYSYVSGRFMFASELKALMEDPTFPRELDLEALQYYLAFGYVPGEQCILKHVHKLNAGHALVYDVERKQIRSWQYWDLPSPSSGPVPPAEELEQELEALLLDSVRLRMIADVPIGVLLSGGIDSSGHGGTSVHDSCQDVYDNFPWTWVLRRRTVCKACGQTFPDRSCGASCRACNRHAPPRSCQAV